MAWDSVPWFVGGGAQHSPETARLLGYVALNGNEGILGAADLQVKQLNTPGLAVSVQPGAVSILNKASGGTYQAYAGRLVTQDFPGIAATGGTARSDLVVARIEDPFMAGEPWADPTDVTVGPYIFTRVIANVANTATAMPAGMSGIVLARIDIPANTSAITTAMIKDLRKLANPRRERHLLVSSPTTAQTMTAASFDQSYHDFPTAANHSVFVPAWATQVTIVTHVGGLVQNTDRYDGFIRNKLGTSFGQDTRFDTNGSVTGNAQDRMFVTGDTFAVPAAMRGTTQTIGMQAYTSFAGTTGNGTLQANASTTIVQDYEFLEVPA